MSTQLEVSTQLELVADRHPRDVTLTVDAYTDEARVDMEDNRGYGAAATFTADQLRQLRRLLEHKYPASDDPPHDPDPWEDD